MANGGRVEYRCEYDDGVGDKAHLVTSDVSKLLAHQQGLSPEEGFKRIHGLDIVTFDAAGKPVRIESISLVDAVIRPEEGTVIWAMQA